MKILLTLLLISTASFAQEFECDDIVQTLKGSVSIPNCLNSDLHEHIKEYKDFSLCGDCRDLFIKRYPEKLPGLDKEELQKKFLNIALEEYRKNITNNLVETVKLSALPETGGTFSRSKQSCKMKTLDDFANGCKSPTALKLLKESNSISELEKSFSNELATILSNKAIKFHPTLLQRSQSACFIPEKQLLYLTSMTVEEHFTPELISYIKNSEYKSIKELFESEDFNRIFKGDVAEFKVSLSSHPLLNEIFSSLEKVKTFFQEIKSPHSINDFRSALYNSKNADSFDERLEKNCDESFKALKNSICSVDFEKGNIDLDPLNNYSRITDQTLKGSRDEFAVSEKILSQNLEFLKYCPKSENSNNLNLSTQADNISYGVDKSYRKKSFKKFSEDKYSSDFGQLNATLCSMNDQSCIEGTFSCSIYKKYKSISSDENSLDYKLARSTSDSTRELLRSMIGDTSKADPEAKAILIAHGIIPQENGKYVEQPEIPERRPEFFAKSNVGQLPGPAKPQPVQMSAAAVASQKAVRKSSFESGYKNDYSNFDNGFQAQNGNYSMPDFSAITKDAEELKNIQDEIRRRLTELPLSNGTPTKAQARKIIRDTMKSVGKTLPPSREDFYADQMISQAPQPSALSEFSQRPDTNRASVSDEDTQLEKWKKNQANAALMGMAGARAVSENDKERSPASVQEKELSKVALNIPDDPTIRLSDVFASKLNENDSETQLLKVLLKNRSNFVLQVKLTNFRVVFDHKQNFNLLLESGDKKEAERIRPQLEIFLKRLKS